MRVEGSDRNGKVTGGGHQAEHLSQYPSRTEGVGVGGHCLTVPHLDM